MDTISTLGQILPDDHDQHRDAIHVAVMPVIAGEELHYGEKLRLAYGEKNVVMSAGYAEYNGDSIGLVDPFLDECRILKGQKFWMWLRPGTITGLRHEWTHPAIDDARLPISKAELWLRQFADRWRFDYDEMIAEATKDAGRVTAIGKDLHGARGLDPGDEKLFWRHVQTLAGQRFDDLHRKELTWTCSC